MDLSSCKPCGPVIRNSSLVTDQQQKEAFYLMQDHEEEDEARTEHASTTREALPEKPFSATKACKPCKEELPTFIACQGCATLRLQQKNKCKADTGHFASGWFMKEQPQNDQLLCPPFPNDSRSQRFLQAPSEAPRRIHKLRFMGRNPSKHSGEQDQHRKQNKQRTSYSKHECASGNTHDCSAEQARVAREELGMEKRRNSSATVEDIFRLREIMKSKERCYDGRSSWEEEVRQAMARGLIHTKQNEDPLGLQRSMSVKDSGTTVLPSTLVRKTGDIRNNATCLKARPKLNKTVGHQLQKMNAIETDVWRGLNVKSPSEERWEEAAEVEERQELQRRVRSQSMRYDTLRSAELMRVDPWDAQSCGNAPYDDGEWAVYKNSGYVDVQPHVSGGNFVAPACCRSLLGRSVSMRDTRMGLVMECAACGAALNGVGGRLLCFCSCCAASRESAMQGGMATAMKKKNGILRACRRLLGLGKKRFSDNHI
ncbi:hypothetical protein L7F22_054226 [Adiantum nelumboides]|nr:hypothetical protein [Adiantum nelumboides]